MFFNITVFFFYPYKTKPIRSGLQRGIFFVFIYNRHYQIKKVVSKGGSIRYRLANQTPRSFSGLLSNLTVGDESDEIAQKHGNGHLADAGHVDAGLLLDSRAVEVAVAREVDAHGAVADQVGGDLEAVGGDAADDNVAEGQHILEAPVFLVEDLVAGLADAAAAGEELDAADVDAVDGSTVVGEQGGQGPAVDLAAVDDGDGLAEEAVAVGEDGVVDLQVLERLDDGERGAGQDGFLEVSGRVEEAHVVIHVKEVGVAEALDILGQGDRLLDVSVLLLVAGPDGVVYDDAVDAIVLVGGYDGLLEVLLVYLAEIKVEAILFTCLLRPLCILRGSRVIVRQEGSQGWLSSALRLDLGK